MLVYFRVIAVKRKTFMNVMQIIAKYKCSILVCHVSVWDIFIICLNKIHTTHYFEVYVSNGMYGARA